MIEKSSQMVISKLWFQAAVITFAIGFTVLGYLAWRIYWDHPPIPRQVVSEEGEVIFTHNDVMAGQHLFQKNGLMQYGTLFGHGAYLGPDFTAQYIHHAGLNMFDYYHQQNLEDPIAYNRIQTDFKNNRYQPDSGTLVYQPSQIHAYRQMLQYYQQYFSNPAEQTWLKRPTIENAEHIQDLTAYFAWAAWVATTSTPGGSFSYTNNWPPDTLAGNTPTAEAFIWSVISIIALLCGSGLVLYAVGRYDLLGWHRAHEEDRGSLLTFRPPEQVQLTPAQRATAWYFLVVAALFLLQGLLGGVNAHYHVEPTGFYGINIENWLPYNLSRTWHLQLALFFVSASYLAMGIFIAPMIAGYEPKHQEKLAIALFGAVVIVVLGSLAGEAASYYDWIPVEGLWFWFGAQGWEFLDLGRFWQILLVAGLFIWFAILFRGMRKRLAGEHPGNLPYLFLYSALSIPLFYAAGLLFTRNTYFVIVDFWRFWVVHLWVEDFLELFTTIMVAYIFVLLGVVHIRTATRVVYLDIILYSIGGVIGTMHHLYFSGAPSAYMALGAFFSAMEVIPLLLLTFEAWRFMQLGSPHPSGSVLGVTMAEFPHKWAVMFLIAVGFWNFLGAGVFGFLINLPIVSYYEIGTQLTANHGHGAMMGVYGMLAMGFFMFVARYFVAHDKSSERAMKISFWSLNIALAMMLFINLVPVGFIQLYESFQGGYWHAREPEFFNLTLVKIFEWLRMPGDLLFIIGGILPVVYLAIRMFKERNRLGESGPDELVETLTQKA